VFLVYTAVSPCCGQPCAVMRLFCEVPANKHNPILFTKHMLQFVLCHTCTALHRADESPDMRWINRMRPLWMYLAKLERLTPQQQQQQQQSEQQQQDLASAQPPADTDSSTSTTAAAASSGIRSSSSSSSSSSISSDEHRGMLRRFVAHAAIEEDYGRAAVTELCKMAAQLCSAEIRQRCAATEQSLQQQSAPPDTKGPLLITLYCAQRVRDTTCCCSAS
jgi:hypothetical protein